MYLTDEPTTKVFETDTYAIMYTSGTTGRPKGVKCYMTYPKT